MSGGAVPRRGGGDAAAPRSGRPEPGRRLFVACDLPADVAAAVGRWQHSELVARDELRVSASLHVTLCFLGNVAERRIAEITAALGALALPPLPTSLGAPLFLPRHGAKHVVALPLDDPAGALFDTQRSVSDALYRLGVYAPEQRPWLAHLTVARYRRPGHPFPLQNVTTEGFGLPSVILYASLLQRGGAVHTPLATFPTPA